MAIRNRWEIETVNEIKDAVAKSTSTNIVKSQKSVWGQFMFFCCDRNYKLCAETSVNELGMIMRDWAYNMKRVNGEDYKESVIKTFWNVN